MRSESAADPTGSVNDVHDRYLTVHAMHGRLRRTRDKAYAPLSKQNIEL